MRNIDDLFSKKQEVIDFSNEENLTKYFSLWNLILHRLIDPAMGRNSMLCCLRLIGILTDDNKVHLGSFLIPYLRVLGSQKVPFKLRVGIHYFCFQINGAGVLLIQSRIKSIKSLGR